LQTEHEREDGGQCPATDEQAGPPHPSSMDDTQSVHDKAALNPR
jgi:hypothetical protein